MEFYFCLVLFFERSLMKNLLLTFSLLFSSYLQASYYSYGYAPSYSYDSYSYDDYFPGYNRYYYNDIYYYDCSGLFYSDCYPYYYWNAANTTTISTPVATVALTATLMANCPRAVSSLGRKVKSGLSCFYNRAKSCLDKERDKDLHEE